MSSVDVATVDRRQERIAQLERDLEQLAAAVASLRSTLSRYLAEAGPR